MGETHQVLIMTQTGPDGPGFIIYPLFNMLRTTNTNGANKKSKIQNLFLGRSFSKCLKLNSMLVGWLIAGCCTCTSSGWRVLMGNTGPPAGLGCGAAAPFQLVTWAESGPMLVDLCRCRRLWVLQDFVPSGKEMMTSSVTSAPLDTADTGSVLVFVGIFSSSFPLSSEASKKWSETILENVQ